MSFTKQAHADALAKIAEVDNRDSANAYELGFYKAAADMGLNDAQFAEFYKVAIDAQATERKAATK